MYWIIGGILIFLILCIIAFVIILNMGIIAFVHLNKKARKKQIRIACVGDSITYGYGVKGWIKNNYPHRLEKMLGNNYCVHNYGRCGATASLTGDLSFEKTIEYKKSLKFKPHIVILMLGTNDSKPHNYKGKEEYLNDCLRIISSYKKNDDKVKTYILTPPPATEYENGLARFDINPKVVEEMRQSLLENKDLNVVDVYKYLDGKKEMFCDGVHPNRQGANVIADTVYFITLKR